MFIIFLLESLPIVILSFSTESKLYPSTVIFSVSLLTVSPNVCPSTVLAGYTTLFVPFSK